MATQKDSADSAQMSKMEDSSSMSTWPDGIQELLASFGKESEASNDASEGMEEVVDEAVDAAIDIGIKAATGGIG